MFQWLRFWRGSDRAVATEAASEAESWLAQMEGDELVKDRFPYTTMSAEEYAARHGHGWGCFSFHLHRYRDPVLGAWVRRLGEILHDAREMERCRRRHLSREEYARVQAEVKDIFENGL